MYAIIACSCGKRLKIPESAAGRRVECKHCGAKIEMPELSHSIWQLTSTEPHENNGYVDDGYDASKSDNEQVQPHKRTFISEYREEYERDVYEQGAQQIIFR